MRTCTSFRCLTGYITYVFALTSIYRFIKGIFVIFVVFVIVAHGPEGMKAARNWPLGLPRFTCMWIYKFPAYFVFYVLLHNYARPLIGENLTSVLAVAMWHKVKYYATDKGDGPQPPQEPPGSGILADVLAWYLKF